MRGLHIHGFIHIIIMYIGSYMYASTQIHVCLSDTNRSYVYARGHRCRLWGQPEHTFPPQIGERPCIYQFLTLFSPQNLGLCPIFLTSLRQYAWMHAYLYANVCTFVCIHLQTRASTEAASVDVLL